jgi:HD-GYP domain-containing protein (c-di-GMP phosphodiesterase class II)
MKPSRLRGPEELSAASDEIAAALYANVRADGRTLILKLLAASFADEYAGAIMEGRTPAVAAWAEEMCAKPGRARAVSQLFEAATRLKAYLCERGLPGRYLPELAALGDIVKAVAVFEQGPGRQGDHLDEVDAAIAEVLARLDAADPGSAVHARNISSWSARLARRLGLPDEDVAFASRCGSLHNIHDFEANALLAPFAVPAQDSRAGEIVAVAIRFSDLLAGDATRAAVSPATALQALASDSRTQHDPAILAALRGLVADC